MLTKITSGGMPIMTSFNLRSSQAVGQNEIENAKKNMGTSFAGGQGMTSGVNAGGMNAGGMANLSSSTSIGQQEVQKVREKVQNSGFQNTTTLS
jgi:hypothetical protein